VYAAFPLVAVSLMAIPEKYRVTGPSRIKEAVTTTIKKELLLVRPY
jgi:hypothetical protein